MGEIDEKIVNIPSLRNKFSEILFDKIFALEILDDITIQEIQKVRDDKKNYKWYERKVIINAISLSLINFKKFDQKKANLIIDFLTDSEENVWESALVGLVIALIYHNNKWLRFDSLKKRLETLQNIVKIQAGLNIIETILRFRVYEEIKVNKQVYSLPFFAIPLNCFLPFFEDNKIFDEALNTNPGNIDPEYFGKYVYNLPLLDAQKYALCLYANEGKLKAVKASTESKNELNRILHYSYHFSPYQNLILEYFNFFSYYPKSKVEDIFSKQMTIGHTKLKSIMLDRTNELLITANYLIDEKNYSSAIPKLIDLLKIEPKHTAALWKIAQCHFNLKQPEYKTALKYLQDLINVSPEDIKALIRIAECYRRLKDNSKALEFYNKAKELDSSNYYLYESLSEFYFLIEEYFKAIELYIEALEKYPNDFDLLFGLGKNYSYSEQSHMALEVLFKCLEKNITPEKTAEVNVCISISYTDLKDFENALKYAQLAYDQDPKDCYTLMNLGRIYLFSKIDLNLARKHLEKSIGMQKAGIIYGNLGHLELCVGNEEKAINYYQECVLLFDTVNDFVTKFNLDLKLITNCGISAEKYNSIISNLVLYWESKREYSKTVSVKR